MEALNPYASPSPDPAPGQLVRVLRFDDFSWVRVADQFELQLVDFHDTTAHLVAFYEGRRARLLEAGASRVVFRRGGWLGTILGPEHLARQQISIHLQPESRKLLVEYHITMLLGSRLTILGMSSLHEVERLAVELGAIQA